MSGWKGIDLESNSEVEMRGKGAIGNEEGKKDEARKLLVSFCEGGPSGRFLLLCCLGSAADGEV